MQYARKPVGLCSSQLAAPCCCCCYLQYAPACQPMRSQMASGPTVARTRPYGSNPALAYVTQTMDTLELPKLAVYRKATSFPSAPSLRASVSREEVRRCCAAQSDARGGGGRLTVTGRPLGDGCNARVLLIVPQQWLQAPSWIKLADMICTLGYGCSIQLGSPSTQYVLCFNIRACY